MAGVLPAAFDASARGRGLICPEVSGSEAAWIDDIEILAPASLLALVNHFKGLQILTPPIPRLADEEAALPDLIDIKGQETAKRALEVVAAGGHNLLMVGPPGAGKSMLARRLPGLLPPLTPGEALEVSMIQSLAGGLTDGAISRRRPRRVGGRFASAALTDITRRAKPAAARRRRLRGRRCAGLRAFRRGRCSGSGWRTRGRARTPRRPSRCRRAW